MLAAIFKDQLIALNVFEYGRLIDRPVRHTFRLYFTHHIHTLIPGCFAVIKVPAKHRTATAVCRSAEASGHIIELPVGSLVLRLENCRVNGDDFAVDVVLVVVRNTIRLGDHRHGYIQLFNLCPKPLGVLLDALRKEQCRINIVVTNGTLGKLLKYVVALSVATEKPFSVGIPIILGKDDFTGTDIHGTEDGVITDHSFFIFHSRHLNECQLQ